MLGTLMKSPQPVESIGGDKAPPMKRAKSIELTTRRRIAGARSELGERRSAGGIHPESSAAPAWRLPGGVRLADFALRNGIVAKRAR